MKILLDAGHAKNTAGKRAKHGEWTFLEYEFNRRVANKLKAMLEGAGHTVNYSCDLDDANDLGLTARALKSKGHDLLFSIHANAAASPDANGYEVFVATNASKKSHAFADSWINEMKSQTNLRNRGKKVNDFTVIFKAPAPAILIEIGFYTNEKEARWMDDNITLIAKICFDSIINAKN